MEIIKFNCDHTFASSYPKAIKSKIYRNNFLKVGDYSLKSRKTQSLSTNYEDRKENGSKTDISMKNINLKSIKIQGNIINKNVNSINMVENKNIEINSVNMYKIPFNGIKNINITNNKNYNNNCVNNNKHKKLSNDYILKPLPPTVPELFNNMYILLNKSKFFCSNSTYNSHKNNKIPNCFYNHLMIRKKIKTKKFLHVQLKKEFKQNY